MKYWTATTQTGFMTIPIATSTGEAKRYTKAHPEITSLTQWHWVRDDCVGTETFTREELLGVKRKLVDAGHSAQWAAARGKM